MSPQPAPVLPEPSTDDEDGLVHVLCCVKHLSLCGAKTDFTLELLPPDYAGPDLCVVCDELDDEDVCPVFVRCLERDL